MTSLSEIEVVNSALREVGESTITSFDDGNKAANDAKSFYPRARDDTLGTCWWIFARRFATLAPLSDPGTLIDYSYGFELPDDYIRMVRTADDEAYKIYNTGSQIALAFHSSTVKIEYIARIEDTTKWDALFTNCVILYLIAKFSMSLAHSRGLAADAATEYERQLARARAINGGGENDPIMIEDRGILNAMRYRFSRRPDKVPFNG